MAIPTLPKRAVKLIHESVDRLFERIAHRFLGRPSGDKRITFGWRPRATLPSLFVEASALAGTKPDPSKLKSLLAVAQGYLDAHREVTKIRVQKAVEAWLHDAHTKGFETDVQTVLGGELAQEFGRAVEAVKTVLDTEATTVRNVGTLDGILSVAAAEGVDDPICFFIPVRDVDLCSECRRLHLLPSGVPRLWRLSQLGTGYHTKGDPNPKVGGLHPRCRCQLATMPSGYGFNAAGSIEYRGVGHDEYAEQQKPVEKSEGNDLEALEKMSRPEGIKTLEALRERYTKNAWDHYGDAPPEYPPEQTDHRITINFPPRILRRLGTSGRFLNQYEPTIRTSGGSYSPGGSRRQKERAILGIHEKTPYQQRPLYGAVTEKPVHLKTGGTGDSCYGAMFAILKPHVHQRATVTPRDSFESSPDQVFLYQHLPLALQKKRNVWEYLEAQIHGGVDLKNDVESLHAGPDSDPAHLKGLVDLGRQYGLPVYHHQFQGTRGPGTGAMHRDYLAGHPETITTHQLHDPAPPAPAPARAAPPGPSRQLGLPGVQTRLPRKSTSR